MTPPRVPAAATRRILLLAAAVVLPWCAGPLTGTAAAAAPLPRGTAAHGSAFGSSVLLTNAMLPSVRSDASALQTLPCLTARGDRSFSNDVAGVDVVLPAPASQDVLRTAAVLDTGSTSLVAATLNTVERSSTSAVSLLGGMVTADAVTAQAHVTQTGTAINDHSTADGKGGADGTTGATFVNLQVAGMPVPVPPPGASTPVPGVGTLYFGEQRPLPEELYAPTGRPRSPGIQVTGLRLHIDDLAGYTGDVVVARAVARVDTSTGVLSGAAYGASAGVDPVGGTGRESITYMPCVGTGGKDRLFTAAGVTVPGGPLGAVLKTGTTNGTLNGVSSPAPARSTVTETVQDVSVLAGMVRARAVTVRAESIANRVVTSTGSTEFAGLVVAGTPVPAPVPGQRIDLPGIGFVALGEQVCTADGATGPCTASTRGQIETTGIRVVVTAPANPLGVPVGTQVVVGDARSGVRIP